MAVRDTRKSKEAYDALFDEVATLLEEYHSPDEIAKRNKIEKDRPGFKCYKASRMGQLVLGLLRAAYARGDSRDSMRKLFEQGLMLLWQGDVCYRNLNSKNEMRNATLYDERFVLSVLVIGVGLGYDNEVLARFIVCTRLGMDELIDRVMAVYVPGRPIHNRLHNAAKYQQLLKVIESPPEKQPQLMKKYLDNWPKKLGPSGPFGSSPFHLRPDYDGYYWCYEAAAVVVAFNVDDSSFIDHEHYPSELMRWCKEGDPVENNLLINEKLMPDYENVLSSEEQQARNLADLTETNFNDTPEGLQEYESVFDGLCAHLPIALRQKLWNTLVDKVWDKNKVYGFVVALDTAIEEVYLPGNYGYRCLLHVDWKDRESAVAFSRDLVKEHGLLERFDSDAVAGEIAEIASIPMLFHALDLWLQEQNHRFIQIKTGDDSYMGTVLKTEEATSLVEMSSEIGMDIFFPRSA